MQCAQAADADNVGLDYWMAGAPDSDPRSDFLDKRLRCYDLILDSLSVFDERSSNLAKAQVKVMADDDMEGVRSHAYDVAFSSEDPVFHSHLYDWLIDRGMADALLEVSVLAITLCLMIHNSGIYRYGQPILKDICNGSRSKPRTINYYGNYM